MGHKCKKNLRLPQKVSVNEQVEPLFVLIANGNIGLLANDDAVVGHGGDLGAIDQIGAVNSHETV